MENREVVARINRAVPDILLVGFGMPLQEKWIAENRAGLDASVIMTVGAAFDYLAGEVRRAPRWATTRGLEWLGRLLVEPHRLWRRYLIGNPLFFWRVFLQKLKLPGRNDGSYRKYDSAKK
jgi:N-acetylglucosaminyldiphosphoundecaprenol N-acetyl-beta-D-mannosaminyltransferase